jgi:hypothetical protein
MAEILELWVTSEQSLRAFAEEQEESYWRLRYWKKKLGIRQRPDRGGGRRVSRSDLIPVQVIGEGRSDLDGGVGYYMVRFRDGTEVMVPPSFSSVDLARLVRVVKSC